MGRWLDIRQARPQKTFAVTRPLPYLALVLCACGSTQPRPLSEKGYVVETAFLPGPGLQRGLTAAERNATCAGCHGEIAKEWGASLHRRSHTDPIYQRAFAIEPMAFCQSCHVPGADPGAAVPAPLADMGIGCVTCHVDNDGRIVSGTTSQSKDAPHEVIRSARLSTADACASCHQFPFPDVPLRGGVALMQSTVDEHARSPLASIACADCHMPRIDGHRSHRFAMSGHPSIIRDAARVEVQRSGPTALRVVIAARGVGHAFPTGDLFRRIEVSAEAVGPEYNVVDRQVRYLTRHFERRDVGRGIMMPFLVLDDRVGPGAEPRVVDIELGPEAAGLPIAWRVAYQRVEHPISVDGHDAVVADEVVLAEGTVEGEE